MLQKLFACDVYSSLLSKATRKAANHIKNMPLKCVSKSQANILNRLCKMFDY
jgi:hypothetical protein